MQKNGNDYSIHTRSGVTGVTGHVICNHEYDLTVRDSQTLHTVVDRQGVGNMTIVEPETRCTNLESIFRVTTF